MWCLGVTYSKLRDMALSWGCETAWEDFFCANMTVKQIRSGTRLKMQFLILVVTSFSILGWEFLASRSLCLIFFCRTILPETKKTPESRAIPKGHFIFRSSNPWFSGASCWLVAGRVPKIPESEVGWFIFKTSANRRIYRGHYLEDHPMTCKWLITMVIVFVP